MHAGKEDCVPIRSIRHNEQHPTSAFPNAHRMPLTLTVGQQRFLPLSEIHLTRTPALLLELAGVR